MLSRLSRTIVACCLLLTAQAHGNEIIVGQVAAFSGPLAPTGTNVRAGAQLYFDKVNATGGVHGAKIKLTSRDDGYKVPETVRLTRELLNDSAPVALIGLVGTGNVEALVKEGVLTKAGVPVVGMRSGATSLIKHPLLFHTRASYAAEVDKIVQQLASIGFKRVAVFYQDDPFGLDGMQAAEISLRKAGVELVAKGAYPKNTTDVAEAVKLIAAAEPQGVIMVSNTAASSAFVQQSRAVGNEAQFVALSVTDGPQVAKRIGSATSHGLGIVQVVPDPNSRTLPLTRELQDVYKQFPPQGADLNHTLLEGYLMAKVLVEGLKRAGPAPTRKKLRDALETIDDFDAGGVFIGFSPTNHSGSSFVDITILNRAGKVLR